MIFEVFGNVAKSAICKVFWVILGCILGSRSWAHFWRLNRFIRRGMALILEMFKIFIY